MDDTPGAPDPRPLMTKLYAERAALAYAYEHQGQKPSTLEQYQCLQAEIARQTKLPLHCQRCQREDRFVLPGKPYCAVCAVRAQEKII